MLLLVVSVTLPPSASPNDSAVLLEACDRAYLAGRCQVSAGGSSSESELAAEVSWLDGTNASVSLGLRRWRQDQWLRRDLRFQAQDESPERYRAMGLALGSLAGTVVEVTRIEASTRDGTPGPSGEALSSASGISQSSVPLRAWAGFALAPGLSTLSVGGQLGLGATLAGHWELDLVGGYQVHGENSELVSAQFATLGFAAGPSIALPPFSVSLQTGTRVLWFSPRVSPGGDTDGRFKLSVFGSATAQVLDWGLSPYLRFSAGYSSPIDVRVDGVRRDTFGPWNCDASAGARWRFE
ncbi:MAG: hypothetical protein RJA70_1301 [Pseudomonadota bacterium]